MTILSVEGLTKIYGSGDTAVTALDHVSFTVEKGEFVAIVGASGSGKSTLMNLIGGIDEPTSGRVVIDGQELYAMNESARAIFRRRNIGMVFQFYNLVPTLTAAENIMLPYLLDKREPEKAKLAEILALTGLSERAGTSAERPLRRAAAARLTGTGADQRSCFHSRRRADRQS